MKKRQTVVTRDYKFILVVALILAVIIGLSFVFPDSSINYEKKDLPEEIDNTYSKLVISEIMTNNSGVYVSDANICCDYIELYNATSEDIDISGYGLSDRDDRIKWSFPDGTIIEAGKYLLVNCTGQAESGLNANFKISSSKNERIILTNKSSKIIDGVDVVSLDKNNCMCRDGDGNWYISAYGTPGYENSQLGLQQYTESLLQLNNDELVVNEFFPRNNGNFINEYDQTAGFIEIKNVSSHSIKLSEYYLSNDPIVPFKKQFDDVVLSSGEIYYLYIGNGDYQKTNYTGFNFDSNNGTVIISKNGKIVQKIAYDNLNSGEGYIYLDGQYRIGAVASMGYENDIDGIAEFQNKYLANGDGLIINEVMNYNKWYLPQNGAQYYDWIELYNNSSSAIQLSQYCLSTNQSRLDNYQLPEYELKPGEYYILMCSENETLTNQTYTHTNFKLSSEESIFLSKNGKIIDCMYISNVPYGYSYGRDGKSGYFYISSPTPGTINNGGIRDISMIPVMSLNGGIYNDVTSLSIEINAPGTIYYTLDGSVPTTSSAVYSGPIVLNKTTVIKAVCVTKGMLASELCCNSFIINENHTLPVVSLSLPQSYINYMDRANLTEQEFAGYIEFYEDDGSFKAACGVSLAGQTARTIAKKGYNISFDRNYGVPEVEYPIFDEVDNSSYDGITLRSGSTDHREAIFRDVLASQLVNDYTDLDTKASKTAILYINGQYWGIYMIREKVNANYITEHYNVNKESVNLLHIDKRVYYGTNAWYNEIISYIRTHDVSTDEAWEYLSNRIDMVNLADEFIAETYLANPDLANVKFFNSTELEDGKLHYIFFDVDRAMASPYFNYYTYYLDDSNGFYNVELDNKYNAYVVYYDNVIIYNLINKSPQFRKIWLERLNYNLRNTFSQENINLYIDRLVAEFTPEIARDRERWGLSVSSWQQNVNSLRWFASIRTDVVLSQTKSFFGLTNQQMSEYFGDLW